MQNKIIRYCQSDYQIGLHPNSTKLSNAIKCVLPMNEMWRLIIEKVFHSLSKIPNFNCDWIENQLFLYICAEGRVEKNKVVHAIELEYAPLLQDSDLVITTSINAATDDICDSTIYINLAIGVRNKYGKSNAIFNL